MRSGSWDGAVTDDNVRVTVNGTVRPVKSVRIQSGMRDGHPASPTSGSWCVESTIEWEDPADVAADAPEPFTGTSWIPAVGDEVVIETGDGQLGQWWVQHRGVIDDTRGSFRDGTATSSTVDAIEELQNKVSLAPLLYTHTPRFNSDDNYRRQGLMSLFMVDRMMRNMQHTTGWYATPPPTWETLGIATGQGSLRPEDIGELIYCHEYDRPAGHPSWINAPYGVAPTNYEAEYALDQTTGYSRAQIVATAAVPTRNAIDASRNHWRMSILDDEGRGVRLWHRHDTDLIYWQTTDGAHSGNRPAVDPATGRRAQRVALYFNRISGATMRLDDGRESSATWSPTIFSGWVANRVVIDCPRMGGWWIVEGQKGAAQRWATLDHVPTARLRRGSTTVWWVASRGLQWTPPDQFLAEQVDAECAAMWLDEDGVMQWAGRGVLDSQSVAQTVTDSLQVDDIQWESRRHALGRRVHMNFKAAEISRRLGGHHIDCWEHGSMDLARGESDEVAINIPEDEDWVSVDLATRLMSASTSAAQFREGSWHGGTIYQDTDNQPGQGWAIGLTVGFVRLALRSWKMTVASWTSNPVGHRIKTSIPAVADRLSEMYHNKPALVVRCKAKVTWVEGERSRAAGPVGPGRYTHDVGWRVQTADFFTVDAIAEQLNWMAGVVGTANPTVTGLQLAHDPRRQVGDKIRVQDRDVTGLWVEVIIGQRDVDATNMLETITGRITDWGQVSGLNLPTPPGPNATTPPSDCNREVAP